jgi:hypothetical protein
MVKMKKIIISILVASLIFTLPMQAAEKTGARVLLHSVNAKQIEGELLVIRPDKIVICTPYGLKQPALIDNPGAILIVPVHEIQYIIVRGRKNTLKGLAGGFLTGFGLGALFGFASGDDSEGFIRFTAGEKAMMLGIFLGIIGGIGGAVVGYFSSTRDRRVEPVEGIGFQHIHTYARYGDYEPDFVRKSENN